MRSNIDSFKEFVDKVNEDSMQIMYTIKFKLSDLMKNGLIKFAEDLDTEDLKNIYKYFEKSYMNGDSLIDTVKVKLTENDIIISFSSTNSDSDIAKNDFADILKEMLENICNNNYATCITDQEKLKKFIKDYYE